MATPTRFPSGVTNQSVNDRHGQLPIPDPLKWQVYYNDFNAFSADDWLATVVDTDTDSANARTIDATAGGVLNAKTDNNAADSINLALGGAGAEPFVLQSGKKAILTAKFSSTDVDKNFLAIGLAPISDVDLHGGLPNDHFLFRVDTADANVDFSVSNDGTATTSLAIGTVADYAEGTNNLTEVTAYFDGKDDIKLFVNNAHVGTVAATNLPSEAMTLQMELHNSDTGADALAVDYVLVAIER